MNFFVDLNSEGNKNNNLVLSEFGVRTYYWQDDNMETVLIITTQKVVTENINTVQGLKPAETE